MPAAACLSRDHALPLEPIADHTELLLPEDHCQMHPLLQVSEIKSPNWTAKTLRSRVVSVLYLRKKDEVIGKVVASEDIPAATQLFTPN